MSSTDSRGDQTANFASVEAIPRSRGRQPNRASIPTPEIETQPSPVSVPLQFVHVPNSHCFSSVLSHRAPSVPDFASFYNAQHNISINQLQTIPQCQQTRPQHTTRPHLSGEALRNAEGADPMDQFEERLRRARLTILLDRNTEFSGRVRSKSTPVRGVGREMRSEEGTRRWALRLEQAIGGTDGIDARVEGSTSVDLCYQSAASSGFDKLKDSERAKSCLPAAPTAASLGVEESQISLKTSATNEETNNSLLQNRNPSCVSWSSTPLDTHEVLPPPPLPPPSSEKERLVQREREARSETKRARRRHLALLRQRQLEGSSALSTDESDDLVSVGQVLSRIGPNETSHRHIRPTSFGSLDDAESVSSVHRSTTEEDGLILSSNDETLQKMQSMGEELAFCDVERGLAHMSQGTQINSPQFSSDVIFSEGAGGLELPPHNTNVDHEENILNHPSSPMSNLAFMASAESTSDRSGISTLPLLPPPATERERRVLREREARLETERARRRHIALLREQDHDHEDQNGDVARDHLGERDESLHSQEETLSAVQHDRDLSTNANCLSYTMERFLETLGEEVGNSLTALTADGLIADDNDTDLAVESSALPYTMELFLSENIVINESHNDGVNEVRAVDTGVVSIPHQSTMNDGYIPDDEHNFMNDSGFLTVRDSLLHVPDFADESNNSTDGGIADLGTHHVEGDAFDTHTNLTSQFPPNVNFEFIQQSSVERFWHAHSENTDDFPGLSPPASPDQLPNRIGINLVAARSNNVSQHLIPSTDSMQLSVSTRQLTDVERASTGNAPPQSVRDEPSESSIVDRGIFRDHTFSIATQTTVVESCTETSQGSRGEMNVGVVDQCLDDGIIRVDDSRHNALSSFQASNASVEAMPSIASVVDSDSHILSKSSSSGFNSSPQTSAFSHLSVDEESQIHNLTQARIVTMAEIDRASIGNAPPYSIRDERLSECSGLGRSHQSIRCSVDNHLFVNPSSGLAFVDSGTANASIEAMPSIDSAHSMSQDSIDRLQNEYNENSLDEGSEPDGEDLAVYRVSVTGSSISIEALPSLDLGSEPEDDPLLNLTSLAVPNEPFSLSMHNGNNGIEEDLVIYQPSDRSSSTSIEVLRNDHVRSERDDDHLSNLDQFDLTYEAINSNILNRENLSHDNITSHRDDTERSPLLPITREECLASIQSHERVRSHNNSTWTSEIKLKPSLLDRIVDFPKSMASVPILVSFISGCFIGLCVGILLFGYRVSV